MGSTVESEEEDNENETVVVVRTSERIRCLATIGSIHAVPDPNSGVTCVTRGALQYTEENYPGAYLQQEGIGYVSIGGAAIVGENDKKKKNKDKNTNGKVVDPEQDTTKKELEEQQQQQHSLLSTSNSSSSSEVVDAVYAKRGEGSVQRVAYTS